LEFLEKIKTASEKPGGGFLKAVELAVMGV